MKHESEGKLESVRWIGAHVRLPAMVETGGIPQEKLGPPVLEPDSLLAQVLEKLNSDGCRPRANEPAVSDKRREL